MATVTSGTPRVPASGPASTWIGTPPTPGVAPAPRQPAPAVGTAGAFGLTPEEIEARRQQTGVSAGGTGYVSGQAPPSGSAMAALGAPRGSGAAGEGSPETLDLSKIDAGTSRATGGSVASRVGQDVLTGMVTGIPIGGVESLARGLFGGGGNDGQRTTSTPGAVTGTPGQPRGATNAQATGSWGAAPGSDTTTTQSALTSGSNAPPPPGTPRGGMPAAANDVTARTGAITSGGQTGTTNTPIATTGNPALDRALDPGGIFAGPTFADLTPALASQRAAFGIQDKLDAERYNYRPGEAAAQDRVALDKARQDELRVRQMQQLDALGAAASGAVPSAAELQLQKQSGKNIAATLGQARALGGRSAGGAARAGTLASADILANTNLDAAATRAAEQDRARQLLAQTNQGIRGQDVDVASQDARLAQEANANNLRSQLEQNELAERHRMALLDQQLKALGIGTQAAVGTIQGSQANAAGQNKYNAGVIGAFGDMFGSL